MTAGIWQIPVLGEQVDSSGRAISRPRLTRDERGLLRIDEFNADLARLQVQLTYILRRLGVDVEELIEEEETLTEEERAAALFFSGQIVRFNTSIQNVVVPHRLNRVPVGYLKGRANDPVTIYDGSTPWTRTNISFRASAPNVQCEAWIY